MALLILSANSVITKDKYTNYGVTAGVGLNTNIYSASFESLPGFKTCCPEYTGATGFGLSFSAGAVYYFNSKLFGSDWKYNINIGYNDLGAAFSDEEFIGNIISGNTYTKGKSEHYLEASLSALSIDQFIAINPYQGLPLWVNAGLSVNFLTGTAFRQEERLLTPSDGVFENGLKTRNPSEGDIPGASTALIALRLGLSYDLLNFGDYTLTPAVNFNYSLNNVAEGLDWKAHTLTASVNLTYRIPRSVPEPPLPAPVPVLPKPPLPVPFALSLSAFSGERPLENGSTVSVKRIVSRELSTSPVRTIVFFGKDNDEPDHGTSSGNAKEQCQDRAIEAIAGYLAANPGVNVTVKASATADETPGTAGKRIEYVKKTLTDRGVDVSRMKFEAGTVSEKEIPNGLIADEYRNVSFRIDGVDGMIGVVEKNEVVSERFEIDPIRIIASTEPPSAKAEFSGKLTYGTASVNLICNKENRIDLNNSFHIDGRDKQLIIDAAAGSESGDKKNETMVVNLEYTDVEGDTTVNTYNTEEGEYTEYILGFFDYNRSVFITHDANAVQNVRKAVAEGKKVVFMPLTDNFGSEEHNDKLAEQRLNAAYSLVGLREGITPVYTEQYIFSNEKPSGRILNRSVIVRIFH